MKAFLGACVFYGLFVVTEHGMMTGTGWTWGDSMIHSSIFGLIFWLALSTSSSADDRVLRQAKILGKTKSGAALRAESAKESYPRTGEYRKCKQCGQEFAPITSAERGKR